MCGALSSLYITGDWVRAPRGRGGWGWTRRRGRDPRRPAASSPVRVMPPTEWLWRQLPWRTSGWSPGRHRRRRLLQETWRGRHGRHGDRFWLINNFQLETIWKNDLIREAVTLADLLGPSWSAHIYNLALFSWLWIHQQEPGLGSCRRCAQRSQHWVQLLQT